LLKDRKKTNASSDTTMSISNNKPKKGFLRKWRKGCKSPLEDGLRPLG